MMSSSPRIPELQAIIDEIGRMAPFASIDEINRLLDRRARQYNLSPQAALGGLSPDEMSQLLYGDWMSEGALRLNDSLTLDELADVPVLADARTLLDFFASEGPVKETAAHNLSRAAVAKLLPRLRIPAQWGGALDIAEPPPINEADVAWLAELRYTMMFARLLIRRKGFRVTARGRELLRPDRAGVLYALLFRTLFRKLDLRVFSNDDRHPRLQSTVAYSFYQLRSAAREWQADQVLAEVAWLESAKEPLSEWETQNNVDFRHYAFLHRVLRPLVQFGLLEERRLPTEVSWKDLIEFRLTPLFDRFVRFEFGGRPTLDPPA